VTRAREPNPAAEAGSKVPGGQVPEGQVPAGQAAKGQAAKDKSSTGPAPPPPADSRDSWPVFFPRGRPLPDGVAAVDYATLPPFQRGLLVIDGTVTTFLEAMAGESLVVRTLAQQEAALSSPDADLALPAGAPVVERSVVLSGQRSGRVYAIAESRIVADRLPAAVRAALATGAIGIGQALRMPGFDSRRDGLWFGRTRRQAPAEVVAQTGAEFLVRCYLVHGGGRPVLRISEFFPWNLVLP
jgi:chorismate lyase